MYRQVENQYFMVGTIPSPCQPSHLVFPPTLLTLYQSPKTGPAREGQTPEPTGAASAGLWDQPTVLWLC